MKPRPRLSALQLLVGTVCAVALSGCRCRGGDGGSADASKESPSALHLKAVDGLALPKASHADALPADGIPVYVTRTKVLLGDEPTEVLPLGDADALAKDGIDHKYKPGDSHYVVLLADAITALRQKKGLGEWTPVAVAMDASIPYAVLADVLVTLQRLRVERYALVVSGEHGPAAFQLSFAPRAASPSPSPAPSTSASASASASTSSSGTPAPAPDAPVYLGVRVDDQGYTMRAFGRALGPGCVIGEGTTVPKREAAYDTAGLVACAMQKKALVPSTHDDAVAITVHGPVDYQSVVRTLDALRTTPDGKVLFPAASFAIVH